MCSHTSQACTNAAKQPQVAMGSTHNLMDCVLVKQGMSEASQHIAILRSIWTILSWISLAMRDMILRCCRGYCMLTEQLLRTWKHDHRSLLQTFEIILQDFPSSVDVGVLCLRRLPGQKLCLVTL